jgi:hypothetical protein
LSTARLHFSFKFIREPAFQHTVIAFCFLVHVRRKRSKNNFPSPLSINHVVASYWLASRSSVHPIVASLPNAAAANYCTPFPELITLRMSVEWFVETTKTPKHLTQHSSECRNHRERERDEKESRVGSQRHYIWGGGGEETVSPVSKVPKQCPFVLVEAMHMIGINFLYDVTNHTILCLLALREDADLFENVETLPSYSVWT